MDFAVLLTTANVFPKKIVNVVDSFGPSMSNGLQSLIQI